MAGRRGGEKTGRGGNDGALLGTAGVWLGMGGQEWE